MRIALLSPYSWTYPGGVTRHIEALSRGLEQAGHETRILAPFDGDDAHARRLHGGARPQPLEAPDNLIALGRTVGISANGAVSNLALSPAAVQRMRREISGGGYDIVHVHEPVVPLISWDALGSCRSARLVGTFHTYSENALTNGIAAVPLGGRRRMNHLHARIAVSQAAQWTALRFFGGRYTIVPNGVDLQPPHESRCEPGPVRILFIGQAVARKGLAVLLAAFERLREDADVELTLIGASAADVEHMILDGSAITALGKVDDAEKQARLRGADIVCAPSLGGESFGMVLTEAFAAGAPVVASDIPGYRDVVRDGVDGLLVPPDDAGALRDALQELVADADRRSAMSIAARTHAERFAWPRVAAEVAGVYEQALAVPEPTGRRARLALRSGLRSADMLPAVPAERLPSLRSPEDSRGAGRGGRRSRLPRPVVLGGVIALLAALAYAAHVDVGAVLSTLFSSEPGTVLGALVVMCLAMSLRAGAWKLLLRSSDVDRQPSLRQVLNATYIGVLMSATLPARMGEPSRAFVLARHTGDLARSLPRVTRTIVAQSLINVVALGVLAAFGASGTSIGQAHRVLLILLAFVPLAAILLFSALPYAIAAVPGSTRLEAIASSAAALGRLVLDGLSFRAPLSALAASVAQLAAWGLQLLGCWLVLMAFGLEHTVGFAGAAAVLFAINITSVLPATRANVGVFQAACALVLVGGFHVSAPSAIAFGIVLQAVELATAMLMGFPALAAEHLSWRQLRRRALHLGSVSKLRRPALVER